MPTRVVITAIGCIFLPALLFAADFTDGIDDDSSDESISTPAPTPTPTTPPPTADATAPPSLETITPMLAPSIGTSPTNDQASASTVLQAGGLPDMHIVLLHIAHTLESVTVTSAYGDGWVSIPDGSRWAMRAMQYPAHQNLVDLLLEPRPQMGLLTIVLTYTDAPPDSVTIDATCAETQWRPDNDICRLVTGLHRDDQSQ